MIEQSQKDNVRIHFIGDRSLFPTKILAACEHLRGRDCTRSTINRELSFLLWWATRNYCRGKEYCFAD